MATLAAVDARPAIDSAFSEKLLRAGMGGFAEDIGIGLVQADGDRVVLDLEITPRLHQPYGIVHGGIHCALVETAASIGAAVWLGADGKVVGVSNQTDFLRAVSEGTLRTTATPIHRGRLQQLWAVDVTDESGRLVAKGQVRLQNLRDA
jgi:uncharacterized protein (TIGR00369 family)